MAAAGGGVAQPFPLPLKKTCERCRLEKIKCDSGSPCGRCLRAGAPDCVYTVNRSKLLRGRKDRRAGDRHRNEPEEPPRARVQQAPPPLRASQQLRSIGGPEAHGISFPAFDAPAFAGQAFSGGPSAGFQNPPSGFAAFPPPGGFSPPKNSFSANNAGFQGSGNAGFQGPGLQGAAGNGFQGLGGTGFQLPASEHRPGGPDRTPLFASFPQPASFGSPSPGFSSTDSSLPSANGGSGQNGFAFPAQTNMAASALSALSNIAVASLPRERTLSDPGLSVTVPRSPAPRSPAPSVHSIAPEDMQTLLDSIAYPPCRNMPGFFDVFEGFFSIILPYMPPLHRVYFFDHMSSIPRYAPFFALLKSVPLSTAFDHTGAPRKAVVAFHTRCRDALTSVDRGQLGPLSMLPRTGVRDVLVLLCCVIPSISMSLESPATFGLVRTALGIVRVLGMNHEEGEGPGWGADDGSEGWTEPERETMRRIWWAIYTLDRQFAAIWEQLPVISDAECLLSLPRGEGFLASGPATARYLADAMRNLGVASSRRAPASAWFSLIGLHSIIGSIVSYRIECASSRSDPHASNPVLDSLIRRLDTWYDGLDPSVRLMDREGVVLGAAARGADASMHESPRSTVVLIHALLIYHAAECMLLAPPGNRISREWDRGTAAARWKEGCLRSGAVLKMMASAGEEGKLSTPFHVFNVHIAALYHVVWLLYVKSQLAGSWHAAVIGSLVTLVAGGHEGDPAASPPKPDVVAAGRFSDLPLVSGAEEDLGDEQPSELPDDAQKEVWAEAFRVIGSMQHLLQTLSALGTRARVKPLATRSRRLLVRLIEEKEPLVGTNHFAGVLLAEGGEEEEP